MHGINIFNQCYKQSFGEIDIISVRVVSTLRYQPTKLVPLDKSLSEHYVFWDMVPACGPFVVDASFKAYCSFTKALATVLSK